MTSVRDILDSIELEEQETKENNKTDKSVQQHIRRVNRPAHPHDNVVLPDNTDKTDMKQLTIDTINTLLGQGKINEAITVKICKKSLKDEEKPVKANKCIDLAMAVVLSADSEDTFDEESFDRLCLLCGKTEDEMIEIMSKSCPACPDD